ncbi:M15 family metallopeptidase [Anaerovorax odorimutans]|uniref:M15 family metallopeptidase n=1 Tax=Anaerovorax odorimutans TaxID=109327 RepID=UPI0003F81F32|nr:M15 family metallopeptidase [Anaerovorax odorimutans]
MKNNSKLKTVVIIFMIIVFLILAGVEIFFRHMDSSPLTIIGGADGPTKIFLGKDKKDLSKEEQENTKQEIKEKEEKWQALISEAKDKGLLILVNKDNPVDENYKPDDLTAVKYYAEDRTQASRYMRKEAAEQFNKLSEAAKQDGYEIVMTTAYRSYGFQKILYDNYVQREGQEAADKFSAKPGYSEHQSGLAVDVTSPSVNYSLSYEYGDTAEGKWLKENAHNFGYIIRYKKGKEDITGYNYEPWHIRYVGETVADEIYEKDITLEEFLEEEQ